MDNSPIVEATVLYRNSCSNDCNLLFFSSSQVPEEDHSPPAPSDGHRNIPPQPDHGLTSSFLRGDYCLVGVSVLIVMNGHWLFFNLGFSFLRLPNKQTSKQTNKQTTIRTETQNLATQYRVQSSSEQENRS